MREDKIFTNRSRYEIVFNILSLCKRKPSPKKTHVLYKCNLSFSQLKMYLNFLATTGFLEVIDKDVYHTTEKGREFIKEYQNIKNLIHPSGLFPHTSGHLFAQ